MRAALLGNVALEWAAEDCFDAKIVNSPGGLALIRIAHTQVVFLWYLHDAVNPKLRFAVRV